MTYKEKEYLKDKILTYLKFRRTSTEISHYLNQSPVVVNYLLEQLKDEWLVNELELIHPPPNPNFNRCEYRTVITNKGQFFLDIEGGHKSRYCKHFRKIAFENISLIAVFVNSIAILWLTYLSWKTQDKTNDLEADNQKIRIINARLEKENLELKQKITAKAIPK